MSSSNQSTFATLRGASVRFWLEAAGWSLVAAAAIAVPTVLVANRYFSRMTPTRWWDYVFLAISAPLIGLVLAAKRLPGASECRTEGKTLAGGGLTYLAVGCPICNKIVVAILGTSGALTYFAPVQPILGAMAVGLLVISARRVLRGSGSSISAPDAQFEHEQHKEPPVLAEP